MSREILKIKNFIDGCYSETGTGETVNVYSPATNEKIAETIYASEQDLDRTLKSSARGQKIWASKSCAERAAVLRNAARIVRSRNDELARLEVLDTGKPVQEAEAVDIYSGADALDYFASACAVMKGEYHRFSTAYAQVYREPLGIVAGIGAWNYPFQIACWKSAPALAAGNAMIFKPAELTPLTAGILAEIFMEAGLPEGVFNVLHGDGRLGEQLVRSPVIKKVSLTGEVGTGQKVFAAGAETLKQITLELGGKSPLIIFDDADLDNAIQASLLANFYTQGEICSNGTRVFVQESILESFQQRLLKSCEKLKVGDPLHPDTQIGALISAEHCEKVLGYIETGIKEGAKVLFGGKRVRFSGDSKLNQGNFVQPTVLTQCHDDMTHVKEEIFGPVMSVLSFKDEEEVVFRANQTKFGLAAGVFTKDLYRGDRVSRAMEAGICWVNNYNLTPIEVPFGGYKMSGLGRENSVEALNAYTQLKTVYVETGDVESPYR